VSRSYGEISTTCAACCGGNYAAHIGSEGFEQEKEIGFAIRVAEEARIPR
jgi:hypothetical protein